MPPRMADLHKKVRLHSKSQFPRIAEWEGIDSLIA